MKIYIKNKKKIFQRMFLGFVLASILLLGIMGRVIYHDKFQNAPKNLVETPNILQKLNESEKESQKVILVFFKENCPYCEVAKTEIEEAKKQADFPVFYVNTESKNGQQLKKRYELKYASSLVIIQKQNNYISTEAVVAYADKNDRGQYIPLTENIKKAFGQIIYK
ncbi:thioredoxin family protein [Lactococcus lactis]|uniref:thioredoxin family protein n=1 Tax=Lactococcus lactis TaxID=1358 RepID=UPI001F570D33|nr:thioredoxin family protein [Lactococcus lactis]